MGKFDATRYQILRLKCTKFDFRWGSAPYPLGELTDPDPPRPIPVFKGPTSKGREGEEEGEGKGEREGEGKRTREGRVYWKEGKGRGQSPKHFGLEPLVHHTHAEIFLKESERSEARQVIVLLPAHVDRLVLHVT